MFLIVVIAIIILYIKTYNHKYVIDDICDRHHWMSVDTHEIDKRAHYNKKRGWGVTLQSISIHIASCLAIYHLFGFWPSMLFAVSPVSVQLVAWKTGSWLYGTSFMFTMIAWVVLKCPIPHIWALSIPFQYFGVQTGSSGLLVPFTWLFQGDWRAVLLLIPTIMFVFGKRLRTGIGKRVKLNDNSHITNCLQFGPKRLIVMVKVTGYHISYLIFSLLAPIFPTGFFHSAGYWLHNYRLDKYFWGSLVLVGMFPFVAGEWSILFFSAALIHSQFVVINQFVSERYMAFMNLAFILVLCKLLASAPILLAVIAALYFYRSYIYIKTWRNDGALFAASAECFTDANENYNNLASWFIDQNRPDRAIEPLLICLKLCPFDSVNIHLNLARCYAAVGQYDRALHHMATAKPGLPKSLAEQFARQEVDLAEKRDRMKQNTRLFKKITS